MWLIIPLGTVLGVFLSGDLNGWWSTPSLTSNETDNVVTPEQRPVTVISATEQNDWPTQELEEKTPDFSLPSLFDDSLMHTLSQYRGRPVILNFWASWCPPCRTEMPALQRAHEKFGSEGLVVLAINQTYSDDVDAAREFAREMALTFPLLRDDGGSVSLERFEILGLPTTIIIRPDGTVASVQVGPMSDDQIDEINGKLVAEEPSP